MQRLRFRNRIAEEIHHVECGEVDGEVSARRVVPESGDFASVAGEYIADDAVRIADFIHRSGSFEEARQRIVGHADRGEGAVGAVQ